MDKQEIKNLLQKENPLIIEIGANNGSDTEDFLKYFKEPDIIAFEPDPRCIVKFKSNKKLYDSEYVALLEYALSNKTGKTTFYQSDGWPPDWPGTGNWDYSGSIKRPTGHLVTHPWCRFDKKIEVDTNTLDNFFLVFLKNHNSNIIDFIWMDVQGAEKEVIEGGILTLTQYTRYLYTEFENTEMYEGQVDFHELMRLLPGFEVLGQYGNNVLLKNRKFK